MQYDSLFIVLKKNGQVLTWLLTKGTTFLEIETLQRSARTGFAFVMCDCCKLRGKISILGSDVLDLFHAIKRISAKSTHLPVKDLRLVFRQDGDSGKRRMLATPEPEEITSKTNGIKTAVEGM